MQYKSNCISVFVSEEILED